MRKVENQDAGCRDREACRGLDISTLYCQVSKRTHSVGPPSPKEALVLQTPPFIFDQSPPHHHPPRCNARHPPPLVHPKRPQSPSARPLLPPPRCTPRQWRRRRLRCRVGPHNAEAHGRLAPPRQRHPRYPALGPRPHHHVSQKTFSFQFCADICFEDTVATTSSPSGSSRQLMKPTSASGCPWMTAALNIALRHGCCT